MEEQKIQGKMSFYPSVLYELVRRSLQQQKSNMRPPQKKAKKKSQNNN